LTFTTNKVRVSAGYSVMELCDCLAGVKAGYFHLCRVAGNIVDPIWQVTLRSCEMVFHEQLHIYLHLTFLMKTCVDFISDLTKVQIDRDIIIR